MGTVTAYIGMGSNLNDPLRQLSLAADALQALPSSQVLAISSCYRSSALTVPGAEAVPDYFNAVVAIETELNAMSLLEACQAIELAQGRVRDGARWQARTLDLDILLYGNEVLDSPRLTIPHPEMTQRDFVLVPLVEIAPAIAIPGKQDIQALLTASQNYIQGKQQFPDHTA